MLGTSVSCVPFLLLLHLLFCLNPSVAAHLQHCQPINQTVSLEKEGCPTCLVFETSICGGHCLTKEPVRRRPYMPVSQHVCTYKDVHYQTVRLPDCPPNVDPFVSFPVALSCECNMCTMDTSDCTIQSLNPDFCMTQTDFEPAYY